MTRGVRIFLRGLSDTLENLLHFVLTSLLWWVCVVTILIGPGAVLALFKATDPRIGSSSDRLGPRGFLSEATMQWRRGWKLALVVVPIVALLAYNLWYYGSSDSRLAILVPAWVLLLTIAVLTGLSAFSIAALLDEPPRSALRIATILTGAKIWHGLVVAFLLYGLTVVSIVLVVPVVMFLPATIAATINRLVLRGLGIPVADPLAPTDERRLEETAAKKRKRFGP
jgi:uncharacterized membrane protein YesL